MASEALVLPVEAQATRWAPTMRAWVKAAVMPLSLKLPRWDSAPRIAADLPRLHAELLGQQSAFCRTVRPSPMVTMSSSGDKTAAVRGSASTPEKSSRPSVPVPLVLQRCSKKLRFLMLGRWFQS